MFKCFCVKRSAVKEDDAFTNLKPSHQDAAPPTVRSCFARARARVGQQNGWLLLDLDCFRNTVFAIPQVQPAVAITEAQPVAVESAAEAVVPSEMMTLEIVDRVTVESDTDHDHLPYSDMATELHDHASKVTVSLRSQPPGQPPSAHTPEDTSFLHWQA